MRRREENYFIKRYTDPLTIGMKIRYRPQQELPSPENGKKSEVEHLCVAAEACVSLVLSVEEEKDAGSIRRFYIYDTKEMQYRMLASIPPTGEKPPLQIEYSKEMLVLRYKERVDIVSLQTSGVVTIPKEFRQAVAGEKLYLLAEDGSKVFAYEYDGTYTDDIEAPDSLKIVAIDYAEKRLHFLTRKGDTLFLDSKMCKGIRAADVKSFGWLGEEEFLFCTARGLFHYDKNEITAVAGKCDAFDTDCLGNLWLLNDGKVMKFVRRGFYERTLVQKLEFDSFKEDTLWNRLEMDASMQEHATLEILVESDTKTELFVNSTDMLLYGHKGEKLAVTLTLISDSTRTASPEINLVKVVFDAAAYIDYLPAFYKEEPETLHRYLSIFQSISDDLAASVKSMERMIDPDLCDETFLSWLSTWLGLQRDYRWQERQWRDFLKQAPKLYAMSGTKEGLSDLIEIYTGKKPQIEEYNEPGKYFFFCVRIDPDAMNEGADIEVVRAIVDGYKPAHTRARVVVGYEMDETPQITVGESVLPFNTVIENEKE